VDLSAPDPIGLCLATCVLFVYLWIRAR